MPARRFIVFYKIKRDRTEEREVFGSVEDALQTAWQILQDGTARVAAITEPGNLDLNIWHSAILRWGNEQRQLTARQYVRVVDAA